MSALYVLSKDKDYVTILVASHLSEFILFFRTLQEQQVNVFCPTSMRLQIIYLYFEEFVSIRREFSYVCHTRYEGNRNMNNMVEEQPEYPETDSPVIVLLPIFNRAFLPIEQFPIP